MKCMECGKEFESSKSTKEKQWNRGDGIMYGGVSYSSAPVCPHCGYDNRPKVYLRPKDKE